MITLTTDFGVNSIHVTRALAWLKSTHPNEDIFEISNEIQSCDINEAAYVLELVLNDFPENTIHIVAVDFDDRSEHQEIVYTHFKGQHILSYNSGLVPVLVGASKTQTYHVLDAYNGAHHNAVRASFSHWTQQIRSGFFDKQTSHSDGLNIKSAIRPVVQKESMKGQIRYFDANGTGYTNIKHQDFEQFTKGNAFKIILGRHDSLSKITDQLHTISGGQTYCYFNDAGYLTIAVHQDQAKTMYGLKKGQTITIEKK